MSFFDKLEARAKATNSLLCVGLDPHDKDLNYTTTTTTTATTTTKGEAVLEFCRSLIKATLPYAVCYKPNAAFFENFEGGMEILKQIISEIQTAHTTGSACGGPLVLLDVKRGDIGSTAIAYAQACYDYLGADAVTLSPLMGWDSVSNFVTGPYKDKAAFVLCKTSNPGSNELMALSLASGETVYERIAQLVGSDWCSTIEKEDQQEGISSCRLGVVVGATDSTALANVRKVAGNHVWILAPGVGAQGGDLKEALEAGLNDQGNGMLVPVSRGISRADDPSEAAKQLQEQINEIRQQQQQQQQQQKNDQEQPLLPYQRDFIEFSLSQGVLKFGSFVLKSGRTSPYFFNAGLFATGQALYKLGKAYASAIMNSSQLINTETKKPIFDIVFGPAYKGISLGALVSSTLYSDYGVDVGFAYNRKEAKDHGEGGTLVGCSIQKDTKVLIVDDVITAGTAIRESYTMLSSKESGGIGAQVVGVIIALDRAEKKSIEEPISAVQAVELDLKIPVVSIVNLPQLQTFLINDTANKNNTKYGNKEEILKCVAEYRAQYGV